MIICGSVVQVADNSGAQIVSCIKVLGSANCANIGDVIIVSIKKAIARGKVKAGDVCKGVVIRVKKKVMRCDGSYICFNNNALVLINDKYEVIGSRVFGMVAGYELRKRKFNRILSLAEEVL